MKYITIKEFNNVFIVSNGFSDGTTATDKSVVAYNNEYEVLEHVKNILLPPEKPNEEEMKKQNETFNLVSHDDQRTNIPNDTNSA